MSLAVAPEVLYSDTALDALDHPAPVEIPTHSQPQPIESPNLDVQRYRTVWISDIHLGTPAAKAEALLDFLRGMECDKLFIVGDLIDGWQLRRSWYWPRTHNTVVQKILRLSRKGTKVIYVPGNHDEFFRDFLGLSFGDIAIRRRAFHRTANGRRFLVLHGDEFDGVVMHHRALALMGSVAYNLLLALNGPLNFVRRKVFRKPYWSLSAHLKQRVKEAVATLSRFEETVAREAKRNRVDGVICGHVHHPSMMHIGDMLYINDGDWVESCTALVEHDDGRLEILQWPLELIQT